MQHCLYELKPIDIIFKCEKPLLEFHLAKSADFPLVHDGVCWHEVRDAQLHDTVDIKLPSPCGETSKSDDLPVSCVRSAGIPGTCYYLLLSNEGEFYLWNDFVAHCIRLPLTSHRYADFFIDKTSLEYTYDESTPLSGLPQFKLYCIRQSDENDPSCGQVIEIIMFRDFSVLHRQVGDGQLCIVRPFGDCVDDWRGQVLFAEFNVSNQCCSLFVLESVDFGMKIKELCIRGNFDAARELASKQGIDSTNINFAELVTVIHGLHDVQSQEVVSPTEDGFSQWSGLADRLVICVKSLGESVPDCHSIYEQLLSALAMPTKQLQSSLLDVLGSKLPADSDLIYLLHETKRRFKIFCNLEEQYSVTSWISFRSCDILHEFTDRFTRAASDNRPQGLAKALTLWAEFRVELLEAFGQPALAHFCDAVLNRPVVFDASELSALAVERREEEFRCSDQHCLAWFTKELIPALLDKSPCAVSQVAALCEARVTELASVRGQQELGSIHTRRKPFAWPETALCWVEACIESLSKRPAGPKQVDADLPRLLSGLASSLPLVSPLERLRRLRSQITFISEVDKKFHYHIDFGLRDEITLQTVAERMLTLALMSNVRLQAIDATTDEFLKAFHIDQQRFLLTFAENLVSQLEGAGPIRGTFNQSEAVRFAVNVLSLLDDGKVRFLELFMRLMKCSLFCWSPQFSMLADNVIRHNLEAQGMLHLLDWPAPGSTEAVLRLNYTSIRRKLAPLFCSDASLPNIVAFCAKCVNFKILARYMRDESFDDLCDVASTSNFALFRLLLAQKSFFHPEDGRLLPDAFTVILNQEVDDMEEEEKECDWDVKQRHLSADLWYLASQCLDLEDSAGWLISCFMQMFSRFLYEWKQLGKHAEVPALPDLLSMLAKWTHEFVEQAVTFVVKTDPSSVGKVSATRTVLSQLSEVWLQAYETNLLLVRKNTEISSALIEYGLLVREIQTVTDEASRADDQIEKALRISRAFVDLSSSGPEDSAPFSLLLSKFYRFGFDIYRSKVRSTGLVAHFVERGKFTQLNEPPAALCHIITEAISLRFLSPRARAQFAEWHVLHNVLSVTDNLQPGQLAAFLRSLLVRLDEVVQLKQTVVPGISQLAAYKQMMHSLQVTLYLSDASCILKDMATKCLNSDSEITEEKLEKMLKLFLDFGECARTVAKLVNKITYFRFVAGCSISHSAGTTEEVLSCSVSTLLTHLASLFPLAEEPLATQKVEDNSWRRFIPTSISFNPSDGVARFLLLIQAFVNGLDLFFLSFDNDTTLVKSAIVEHAQAIMYTMVHYMDVFGPANTLLSAWLSVDCLATHCAYVLPRTAGATLDPLQRMLTGLDILSQNYQSYINKQPAAVQTAIWELVQICGEPGGLSRVSVQFLLCLLTTSSLSTVEGLVKQLFAKTATNPPFRKLFAGVLYHLSQAMPASASRRVMVLETAKGMAKFSYWQEWLQAFGIKLSSTATNEMRQAALDRLARLVPVPVQPSLTACLSRDGTLKFVSPKSHGRGPATPVHPTPSIALMAKLADAYNLRLWDTLLNRFQNLMLAGFVPFAEQRQAFYDCHEEHTKVTIRLAEETISGLTKLMASYGFKLDLEESSELPQQASQRLKELCQRFEQILAKVSPYEYEKKIVILKALVELNSDKRVNKIKFLEKLCGYKRTGRLTELEKGEIPDETTVTSTNFLAKQRIHSDWLQTNPTAMLNSEVTMDNLAFWLEISKLLQWNISDDLHLYAAENAFTSGRSFANFYAQLFQLLEQIGKQQSVTYLLESALRVHAKDQEDKIIVCQLWRELTTSWLRSAEKDLAEAQLPTKVEDSPDECADELDEFSNLNVTQPDDEGSMLPSVLPLGGRESLVQKVLKKIKWAEQERRQAEYLFRMLSIERCVTEFGLQKVWPALIGVTEQGDYDGDELLTRLVGIVASHLLGERAKKPCSLLETGYALELNIQVQLFYRCLERVGAIMGRDVARWCGLEVSKRLGLPLDALVEPEENDSPDHIEISGLDLSTSRLESTQVSLGDTLLGASNSSHEENAFENTAMMDATAFFDQTMNAFHTFKKELRAEVRDTRAKVKDLNEPNELDFLVCELILNPSWNLNSHLLDQLMAVALNDFDAENVGSDDFVKRWRVCRCILLSYPVDALMSKLAAPEQIAQLMTIASSAKGSS